ncbi:Chromatin structure remodeling complex protein sfh1 [Cytospora paraplurivora]|uniref:Chromatin structure remodeling complex protein sfh1 n=1 Tax=Cytospora paraplurivora TaxID=2898453 RepID=A0AAN9UIL8_9PEZI
MATAKEEPQAFFSTYAPRLRAYRNSLLTPVLQSSVPTGPVSRTTKRGTTIINYAEDGYEIDDSDDDDSRRRPTGLRSLRREDSTAKFDVGDKFDKETAGPVEVQGIYRDWMNKSKQGLSDMQNYAQASLPLTLIPIRIDLDIPAFAPLPAHPPPAQNMPGIDYSAPQYKMGELTVPYKLRDAFLWNLHETLTTTDQFAATLVQDLDLPNRNQAVAEISKQIRTQLEEYAGVALHPLFHSHTASAETSTRQNGTGTPATPIPPATGPSGADTPGLRTSFSHIPATPSGAGGATPGPGATSAAAQEATAQVSATAEHVAADLDDLNPDDTYRCIINLNINLGNHLYTDRFEWSLLHPPGTAEAFSKQTCADLGLTGEWVPAMTHAIYEAVLRLKKEACEKGGVISGWVGASAINGGDFPNDAAITAHGERAGWRYEPEHLADEWEPKIEVLSKEEIEKREGDRERQIRRLRRETARFSSNAGMVGGVPTGFGFAGLIEQEGERMGRGERSKKKRRFRSLSPLRSSTPGARATPDVGGGGYGGGGTLAETERFSWRCRHCMVWGTSVWAVRDGPQGPRTLCNNCGFVYERDRKLPRWTKDLHKRDLRPF